MTRIRLRTGRRSVRLRLTLSYAGLFVVSSAVLLALNYGLLYQSLYSPVHSTPAATTPPTKPGTDADALFIAGLDPTTRAAIMRAFAARATPPNHVEDAIRAQERNSTLVNAAETSAVALGVMAVVALGLGWLFAGRMLRPLNTLTTAARHISSDHLDERIALDRPPDELKELADTFDAMVARLESSFTSQRRFIANASHELRTPLAIARTSVEVVLAKRHPDTEQWEAMACRVLAATGRAERLLDGLLALARSDRAINAREPHDLAVAAATALADIDQQADAAGLDIRSELRPAPVTGDPALLDRLVANLVDNAIRYNRPGGWVTVHSGTEDGRSVVRIRNSGPVLPAEQVDRLFEPFHRLGQNRTGSTAGSGLGLAIVRSIVQAHQGTVHASTPTDGGLAIEVSLPSSDSALSC
jgi:signal transduction histidine kinase